MFILHFFFQAEDGIRVAQESRGLGDVYKRQPESEAQKIKGISLHIDQPGLIFIDLQFHSFQDVL